MIDRPFERYRMLALLAFAGALSHLDRQVVTLLVEPIKQDLGLTDVQLSLLQGLAFIFIHTMMVFPVGYMVDRHSRRAILSLGILIWSFSTAACGFARSFGQLFGTRIGVGMGEATLLPVVQSVMPDLFDSRDLPRGFSIFQAGMYIGNGGAYAVGGLIFAAMTALGSFRLPGVGIMHPWQLTFLVVALPGPILAILLLMLREPDRRANPLAQVQDVPAFGRFLRERRGFLIAHLGAVAIMGFIVFGVAAWAPSFFIRSFGWSPTHVGIVYGLVIMLCGGAGTLAAAPLARYLDRANDNAGPARLTLVAVVGAAPTAIFFSLGATPLSALVWLGVFNIFVGLSSVAMPATLQLATPHAYRGRIGAFYVFAASAIGAALGPVAVAAITQLVLQDSSRLRDAILLVCLCAAPVALIASWMSYYAFRKLTQGASVLSS